MIDLFKVYSKLEEKEIENKINFLDGQRKCPNCNSDMKRDPLGHTFLRHSKGKTIINVNSVGMMIKSDMEVPYAWFCTECPMAMSPTKPVS